MFYIVAVCIILACCLCFKAGTIWARHDDAQIKWPKSGGLV